MSNDSKAYRLKVSEFKKRIDSFRILPYFHVMYQE